MLCRPLTAALAAALLLQSACAAQKTITPVTPGDTSWLQGATLIAVTMKTGAVHRLRDFHVVDDGIVGSPAPAHWPVPEPLTPIRLKFEDMQSVQVLEPTSGGTPIWVIIGATILALGLTFIIVCSIASAGG